MHQKISKGLVIAHYGETIDLEDLNNNSKETIKCNLRKNLPKITVGDIVNYSVNTNINTSDNNLGNNYKI